MDHSGHKEQLGAEPFFLVMLAAGLGLYLTAVILSNNKHRKQWPMHRPLLWCTGIFCAALALVGPLSNRSSDNFIVHMIGHLLLGMLAPLLMVLSAPMALLLRTLNVSSARRLAKLLKSRFIFLLSHPITAMILNISGLFALYTTDLYSLMHHHLLVHLVVHAHIFLAGYLFTAAILAVDPMPHRFTYLYRSTVLVLALAGHGILSKYIYANPPAGVPLSEAETGGMLMYYGGDAIDLILIIILCNSWYKAVRPKPAGSN
jgi:putative membrane protein